MIFVTGATGLLGSFIVEKLISEGYQLRCLKRANSDISFFIRYPGIEWIEGDLSDISLLQNCMEGIEIVIHAAGIVSFSPSDMEEMEKTNVEGTANVVNTALLQKIKKLIFVSSVASLGRVSKNAIIDENSLWVDSPYNSYYAKTKYRAELEVWRGAEEGLNAVVINPSIILGTSIAKRSSSKLVDHVLSGNIFYPPGKINFVDVRDVADIIFLLIKSSATNQRYIISGGSTSYRHFFNLLADQLQIRKPHVRARYWMMNLAWRLAGIKSMITGRKPLITRETILASQTQIEYKNEKLIKLLNFKYRTIENTISWIGNFYLNRE